MKFPVVTYPFMLFITTDMSTSNPAHPMPYYQILFLNSEITNMATLRGNSNDNNNNGNNRFACIEICAVKY
jgi:hypothetical protein